MFKKQKEKIKLLNSAIENYEKTNKRLSEQIKEVNKTLLDEQYNNKKYKNDTLELLNNIGSIISAKKENSKVKKGVKKAIKTLTNQSIREKAKNVKNVSHTAKQKLSPKQSTPNEQKLEKIQEFITKAIEEYLKNNQTI